MADAESGGRDSAIRLITINPTLRAEAERLLPVLDQMKAPASREEIIVIVMREMPAWGVGRKQAVEYELTFSSYADALEGHSVYAIEEAVVRWNDGQRMKDLSMGGFPPRPAQLGFLCQEAKNELYMAAYRAKLAVQKAEVQQPRIISPEERAQVAAGMAELRAQLGSANKMDEAARPRVSPQQMAEQLRAAASAPSVEDPGDVI